MISYSIKRSSIENRVYIPKYYDPDISVDLESLKGRYTLVSIGELEDSSKLSVSTGDEIGKDAYGTGVYPFVRTSDISNWEIKTAPKQGVSREIFDTYAKKQDIRDGDILLVRDGTYLIGTNCFVTGIDKDILYQSHILKFRITDSNLTKPEILFLALNSDIVQRQIRSVQFTADIIDTIGRRYREIKLPFIDDKEQRRLLAEKVRNALSVRVHGKAFIKQAPLLIEECLRLGTLEPIRKFHDLDSKGLEDVLVSDTVTLEFGEFEATKVSARSIVNRIYLPKYYDPEIEAELEALSTHSDILSMRDLVEGGLIEVQTGDEIGKLAYGTGDIPFYRTSDFANWEIKHDPKQGISEGIYSEYSDKQNLRPLDILLVRDGTYLVGSSTIVQPGDQKALYCGGLFRIRTLNHNTLPPYLLLALLNSYVVKRQMRSKQFTRDVIDTLGNRLFEVRLPIPRDASFKSQLANEFKDVVEARGDARDAIRDLAKRYGR